MQILSLRHCVFSLVSAFAVLTLSGWANADPPSRIARLGYTAGAVSFSPAGENEWVQATVNRPLTNGDRLWVDAGARAEIQVGGAMIRMNSATSVSILNLDDRIAQLQLTQGTLNVRVRRLDPDQVFEVDTPNLAFTLRQPGEYRIAVDPEGNATDIIVRKGQGEVYGESAAYVVDSRQPYRFMGTGLREYQVIAAPRLDDFDRWASARDRALDSSSSARYVSPNIVGYQDLDASGSWRFDPNYGNMWTPDQMAAGWAPYRNGHWAWVDPWGWTWVDDAPWGFAVSHYGRWANLRGTWAWVPGPIRTQAYYAPALVAFVGGSNFQLTISSGNVGGVAWFPLAPREVYQPSYPVSRGYFENVNRSNTVINNTVINNTYNTTNVNNVVYANRQVPGAIVAVPTTVFVQSQPVSRSAVRVPNDKLARAPVAVFAPVAPNEKSVRGDTAPGSKPPARVFERPVVARTAPPSAQLGFAAQQPQLTVQPGKPLDDTARKGLKPAMPAPVPTVKVLVQTQATPPTTRPPQAAPSTTPVAVGGKPDVQKAPAISGGPGAATQQLGKTEPPGKGEQQLQAVAPPPRPLQRAPERRVVPPEMAPSAPATLPSPQRSTQPKVATPTQISPPAPVVQQIKKPEATPAQGKPEPGALVGGPGTPAQRPAPPIASPITPGHVVRPPAQPEGVPATTHAEPRPRTPEPKSPPPVPQTLAAPRATSNVQKPKPAVSSPVDIKNDTEDRNPEDEIRKQRR